MTPDVQVVERETPSAPITDAVEMQINKPSVEDDCAQDEIPVIDTQATGPSVEARETNNDTSAAGPCERQTVAEPPAESHDAGDNVSTADAAEVQIPSIANDLWQDEMEKLGLHMDGAPINRYIGSGLVGGPINRRRRIGDGHIDLNYALTNRPVERQISKLSILGSCKWDGFSSVDAWINRSSSRLRGPQDDVREAGTVERRRIMLPLEIELYIIDLLDNEYDFEWRPNEGRRAIMKCARVCKAWMPISRKLYDDVRLYGRKHWASFERAMLPSSTVAEYMPKIKRLSILERPREQCWAHIALFEGATVLTGLEELILIDVNFRRWNLTMLRSGECYHSLTTLVMHNYKFSNTQQVHFFVSAFPALIHLKLSGPHYWRLKFSPTLPNTVGPPLTHLELAHIQRPPVSWLAATHLIRTLTSLTVDGVSGPLAWRILTESIDATSLKELHIQLGGLEKGLLHSF